MMIEFQCENLVFNPSLGHNVPCGHRMIVPDSKVGETVLCPKCQEETEVPFHIGSRASRESSASIKPQRLAPVEKSAAGRKKQVSPNKRAASDEFEMAAIVRRPKSDLSAIDFGSETNRSSSKLTKDQHPRCRKCGELMDPKGRCSACGFREPIFEKATQPLAEIKVGRSGFQLWFVNTIADAIPFKYLEWGAHISVAILVCLSTFAALVGLHNGTGVVLALLFLGLGTSYVVMVVKGHQLASNPHAQLAWYQKPLWNVVLFIARRMNWQDYDQRFKGRTIIDRRGEGITDSHLPELENLELCEVLDLERTPVTDQGLRHLYGLRNLHCIVLRKTGVTPEGVFRLQQTHRQLWIWY